MINVGIFTSLLLRTSIRNSFVPMPSWLSTVCLSSWCWAPSSFYKFTSCLEAATGSGVRNTRRVLRGVIQICRSQVCFFYNLILILFPISSLHDPCEGVNGRMDLERKGIEWSLKNNHPTDKQNEPTFSCFCQPKWKMTVLHRSS